MNRRVELNWAVRWVTCFLAWGAASIAAAGNVFVTGHDPDFHASFGGNALGAQRIIQQALAFTRNGNPAPILYLQSNTSNNSLGDHVDSEAGLIASGYTAGNSPGNFYVKVNATEFAAANLSLYSTLFVPSDHGGSLTGDDLAALNARTGDIVSYVNAGGGLVALAEDGNRTPAAVGPQPQNFGFLPFLVTTTGLSQGEAGFTVTPYGASLGLTSADVNGNASHTIFLTTGGLNVVDLDAAGNIITLAGSGPIVPEPSSIGLAILGLAAVHWVSRRRATAKR